MVSARRETVAADVIPPPTTIILAQDDMLYLWNFAKRKIIVKLLKNFRNTKLYIKP